MDILRNRLRGHRMIEAVALTVFLFSLLVWVYVVVIQVTHPEWLRAPFSHITYPPFDWRLDEVGMTAFAISAVSFLIYRFEKIAKVR